MNANADIIFSESQPEDIIPFLEEKIYEYNSSKIKKDDGKLFAKTIRDTEDNIIAGISGWVWADACEITLLWVKDEYRNKGYGSLLLEAAEQEAQKKNCKIILLKSYDFQAPSFYQKYNYQIELITKDFPPGHSYYCLIKRI